MKTEIKVDQYTCDNPACGRVVLHDPEYDEAVPWGYHGTASLINERGGIGGEWFACKKGCVRGAVLAVAGGPDDEVDEDPKASIERGVVQVEAGEATEGVES